LYTTCYIKWIPYQSWAVGGKLDVFRKVASQNVLLRWREFPLDGMFVE